MQYTHEKKKSLYGLRFLLDKSEDLSDPLSVVGADTEVINPLTDVTYPNLIRSSTPVCM